jgi:hypothetical protein
LVSLTGRGRVKLLPTSLKRWSQTRARPARLATRESFFVAEVASQSAKG